MTKMTPDQEVELLMTARERMDAALARLLRVPSIGAVARVPMAPSKKKAREVVIRPLNVNDLPVIDLDAL